jgi:hypothetical protein
MTKRIALALVLTLGLLAGYTVVPAPQGTTAHHRPWHKTTPTPIPTPVATPSPTPAPTSGYRAIVYDMTSVYQPYVQGRVAYYASQLEPSIDLEYRYLGFVPLETCDAMVMNPPGVKVCEKITTDGNTSATTTRGWSLVNGTNYLYGTIWHFWQYPEWSDGYAGRYQSCHELGHVFGLWHVYDAADQNCMSVINGYAVNADWIQPWQRQWIIDNRGRQGYGPSGAASTDRAEPKPLPPSSATAAGGASHADAPKHTKGKKAAHGKKHAKGKHHKRGHGKHRR